MEVKKVIYAGSFNLFHAGHMYVYNQACDMFGKDNVYLCVAINKNKSIDPTFIKWTLNPITPNVIVANDLVVNENPDILIRGLRDSIDLAAEMTMADWNNELGCNTIFIPCTGRLRHISSSALRELHDHGILTNDILRNNIPSKALLTFKRWKTQSLPERKLFCGKISIGKSTYLNNNGMIVGDCDKLIWQFFSDVEKINIKKKLMECINNEDNQEYSDTLYKISKNINWDVLFSTAYFHYEVSALGQWMQYIPHDILTAFQIVELQTSDVNRMACMISRKLDVSLVKKFDKFYKSPLFVDEVIKLNLL